MRALYNDVINKTLSEIDVEPSKKAYCKVLGCHVCRMDIRSIQGKMFGLVQDAEESDINIISGNNIYNNPELLGSFILLGLTKGRLNGFTENAKQVAKTSPKKIYCLSKKELMEGKIR